MKKTILFIALGLIALVAVVLLGSNTPSEPVQPTTSTSSSATVVASSSKAFTLEYLESQLNWKPTMVVEGMRRVTNEEWIVFSDGREFTITPLGENYWLQYPTPSRDTERQVPTWLFVDGAWKEENLPPTSVINTPFDTAAIENANMWAILDYNQKPIHQFVLEEEWSLQKMKIYSFGYEGLMLPDAPSTKFNANDDILTIYIYRWDNMQNSDSATEQLHVDLDIHTGHLVSTELIPAEIRAFTPKGAT